MRKEELSQDKGLRPGSRTAKNGEFWAPEHDLPDYWAGIAFMATESREYKNIPPYAWEMVFGVHDLDRGNCIRAYLGKKDVTALAIHIMKNLPVSCRAKVFSELTKCCPRDGK